MAVLKINPQVDSRAKLHEVGEAFVGATIILIDDHKMIGDGLTALVGVNWPNIQVFYEANLEAGIERLSTLEQCDLCLLDLGLPGHRGISALTTLQSSRNVPRIAIYSANDNPKVQTLVIQAGAVGYLSKSLGSTQLVEAIGILLHGGNYIPQEMWSEKFRLDRSEEAFESFRYKDREQAPAESPESGMTGGSTPNSSSTPPSPIDRQVFVEKIILMPPKRREILRRLVQGMSNKEICRDVGLSMNTIKTHITLIFHDMNLHSRREITLALHRHHLLTADVDQLFKANKAGDSHLIKERSWRARN